MGALALLNGLFRRHVGGARHPPFHDIDATCPSLRLLDRNHAVIREELLGDPGKSWRVFMLAHVSGGIPTNQARCPRPSALQAFFSILDPGLDPSKSIPAHDGPYLGYLRYHLALMVPRVDPPSMRVKDQVHTWPEGRSRASSSSSTCCARWRGRSTRSTGS